MKRSALLLCLALAACATRGGFEKTMNSYLGASEGALVLGLGPPQNVYVAPDGSRTLTFGKTGNVQTGGGTTYQPVTSTTNGNVYGSRGTANYSSTSTAYVPVQQPTYNITLSCTVSFRLMNDRVETWQANGNHCVN